MVVPPDRLVASNAYVIAVLFVAVAVYPIVAPPWQRVVVAPRINTGVPTVGVTAIVWFLVLGPLQPAALAVTTVVPLHPAT